MILNCNKELLGKIKTFLLAVLVVNISIGTSFYILSMWTLVSGVETMEVIEECLNAFLCVNTILVLMWLPYKAIK